MIAYMNNHTHKKNNSCLWSIAWVTFKTEMGPRKTALLRTDLQSLTRFARRRAVTEPVQPRGFGFSAAQATKVAAAVIRAPRPLAFRSPPANCLHCSICACHPRAGAMLIFSVSFQIVFRMIPEGNPSGRLRLIQPLEFVNYTYTYLSLSLYIYIYIYVYIYIYIYSICVSQLFRCPKLCLKPARHCPGRLLNPVFRLDRADIETDILNLFCL